MPADNPGRGFVFLSSESSFGASIRKSGFLSGMVSSPPQPLSSTPPSTTAGNFENRHQIDLDTQAPPKTGHNRMFQAGCARRQPALLGRRTGFDRKTACEPFAISNRRAIPQKKHGRTLTILQTLQMLN